MDSEEIDWNSDEGKQATARLKSFVRNIDQHAAKNGEVRKVVSLKSDSGEELKIITWGKA